MGLRYTGNTYYLQIRAVNPDGNGNPTAAQEIYVDYSPPTLHIDAHAAVSEGDSGSKNMTFTVTLSPRTSSNFKVGNSNTVTVAYAVDSASSTADSGTDYTLRNGTLTFGAGETSKTIRVSVTGDEKDESDETVVIALSNPTVSNPEGTVVLGVGTGKDKATGTITDDDASPVLAEIADKSVEAGTEVTITASATDADGDTIAYAWTRKAGETSPALPQGTAENQAQLTFTPTAAGMYTMTVTASDGKGNQDTEEVVITVTGGTPSALPVLQLLTDPSAATEGDPISLTVTSDKALTGALQVSLTLADRETSGFGAADIPGALTQTFPATFGDTASLTGAVSIPTTLDSLLDGAETYTITLNAGTGYELGADKTAEGALNEGTAEVSVPATLTVAENGGNAEIAIATPRKFGAATTFNVTYGETASTSDTDATGAPDGDYDNDAAPSVTFDSEAIAANIVIPITNDKLDEDDETFTVTIAAAAALPAGFALGDSVSTVVTITDDDSSPVLTAIDDVSYTVGQTVDITASATDADNDTITYAWTRKAGETAPAIPQGTAVNQAQLTFVTAAAGTYTMTVTANDGNGNTDTEEVTITVGPAPTDPPAKPTGFTAAAGDEEVKLTWDDPGGAGITWQFRQREGRRQGPWANIAAGDIDRSVAGKLSYTVDELDNGVEYDFRIRGQNAAGTGRQSARESATPTPPATVVPVAPTGFVAKGGNRQVTLYWTDPKDANIIRWEILQKKGSASFGTNWTPIARPGSPGSDAATLHHVVTGLENGAAHAFKLLAVNAIGDGAASAEASATPKAPAAATLSAAAGTTGEVTLNWTVADADPHALVENAESFGVWQSRYRPKGGDGTTTLTDWQTILHTRTDGSSRTAATNLSQTIPHGGVVELQVRASGSKRGTTAATWGPWSNTATITLNDDADPRNAALTIVGAPVEVAPGKEATYTVALKKPYAGTLSIASSDTAKATVDPASLTFTSGNYETAQTVTVTGVEAGSATINHAYRLSGASADFIPDAGTVSVTVAEPTPAISLSIADASASEDAGTLSFTVTASSAPSSEVTFEYTVTAESTDTAVEDTDFTGDELDESDETVVIKLSSPVNAVLGTATGTGTITDDDASPVLTAIDDVSYTVGQTVDITASATDADNDTITYAWTRKAGEDTPALPQNTAENQAQLTFVTAAAGTYTMTVTASDGKGNSATEDVTITVTEALPALQLLTDPSAVTEGDPISLTVTSDKALTGALQVSLTLADRETSGFGAADIPGALTQTFPATFGDTASLTGAVSIPTTLDSLLDGAETYTITLNAGTGYELGADKTAEGALNEGTAEVSVPATLTVAEDGGNATIAIATPRKFGAATTFNVTYGVTASTSDTDATGAAAPADGDYDDDAATSVTFDSEAIAANIVIPITDDAVAEGDETFMVTITAADALPAGFALGDSDSTVVTITDDEGDPTLSIAAPSAVTEGDSGSQNMVFTVTLDPVSAKSVTVGYAVASASTATSGTDHAALADDTLTFPAETATQTITVSVTGDEEDESAETVVIEISSPTGGAVLGTATATGTITDDDASPVLTAIADVSYTVGQTVDITAAATDADGDTITYAWTRKENEDTPAIPQGTALNQAQLTFATTAAGTYTMTVTASDGKGNSATEDVTITVSAAQATPALALSGTANGEEGGSLSLTLTSDINVADTLDVAFTVQGSVAATDTDAAAADFNGGTLSGIATASFANGKTATVTVPLTDDGDVEGDEGFRIALASGSGYTLAASSQTLAGTITDNDGIRLVAASGEGVFEGGTQEVALEAVATTNGGVGYSKDADFAATLSGVSWSYQGGAAAAADFDTTPTSATFASGDASVDFVAASDGDAQESYSIKLAAVTGHTVVSGSNAVTGNIGPIVTAKWSAAAYSATEGGAARLTLTLDAPVVKDITVFIDTEDGSAASPGDFTSGGHSLSLSAGQSSAILSIALKQDSLAEGDETFDAMITGSDHPASVIIGDPDTAEVTIIDDEAGVRATPPLLTVAEGATGTYTVVLRTDPMGAVTVTPSSGDTSAATVSPASLTFDTSNWRTPKTVTVTGKEDADGIGETVVVDHAVSGYAGVTRAPSVTVVLTDNETLVPAVVVSRSRLTVTEAGPGTGTYTVRLNTNPGGDVTVTPSSNDTSAAVVSGALTFTRYNWDEAQTVTVTAVDDSDMVGESVTVSHGVVGYSGVSNGPSVAVTLIDDDVVPAGVTVTPTALTVNEGASATYTVKLDAEPSDGVTVTVAGASGDVTVSGSPMTFTAQNYGEAKTITVSADSDADATDDTATLTHSASGGGYGSVDIPDVNVTVTDTTPVLQLLTDPSAVTEGTAISLEVTSDKTVTGTLQVSLTLADRETSGFDADDIPGALGPRNFAADFSAGGGTTATVSISTSADSDAEGAETYTITLNDAVAYELGADKSAAGTLNDPVASSGAPCRQSISGPGIHQRNPRLLSYTLNVPANCGPITKTEFQIRTSGQSWSAVRWLNTGFGSFSDSGQPQSKVMLFNLAPSGQALSAGLREMRVRAFNGSEVGPVSETARLWIGLPAQPTGLRASGGHKHVQLSWDDAENPSIRRWEVQRKSGAGNYGGWTPITVSTTRHRVSGTVSGLDNGTLYGFKVRAVNSSGASTASAEASATPGSGAPSAPSGLTATPGNGRVTLSWRPLGDSSVTKWQVRRKASSASWPTTSGGGWSDIGGSGASTASHAVTGLTNGTSYDFEVRAVNEVGNGGASAISSTPTTLTVRGVTVPRSVEIGESAGFAVVRITAEAAFGEAVTFNVSYGSTSTTRDNDATGASNPANGDYDNDAVASVMFNATETTKDIRIPITNDLVDEGDETFTVTISSSGSLPEGFVLGSSTTTVTIAEDDVKRVTVSTDFLRIVEGGAGTYTVALETQPTGDVSVTVSGAGGGVTVSPSPLRFTRSNWSAAQTVTVRSTRHDPDGDDAQLRLTHRASGGGYAGAPVRYVTDNTQPRTSLLVVVRDNNRKGVTLSASELTVVEGGSKTYTAKLDTRPSGDVTLTVGGASGDVTVSGSPLTFTSANWNEAQTLTVNAAEDGDAETDAAVTLTHSAEGGGYSGVKLGDTVVVRVADNDVSAPAKPTGFSATAGDGEATLSWTDPVNATIIGWEVQRKSGSGGYGGWLPIDDSDATTTSHTVSGLTNYTRYGFKVRAVNGAGGGTASDEAAVTPVKPAPCKIGAADVRTSAPGGSGHSIAFGVRIPANCGAITGLQYQVRSSGGTWPPSWTDFDDMATSFADSGSVRTPAGRERAAVTGGAAREVRVRALNVRTPGTASEAVGATFVVPSQPTGLSATGGEAKATLSWDAQPGEGITAWVVEYRQGSAGEWQSRVFKGAGGTTSVSVTGLQAAAHSFRLKARNVYGDSVSTAAVTATPTPATMKPLPPTGLSAKAGASSVTLTWDDPRDANIEWWGYQYRWTQGGEEQQESGKITPSSAGAGKLTTTIAGLTPGTSYRFRILLRNAVAPNSSPWVTATPTVGLSIADVTAAEDGTFGFTVTSTPAPGSAVTFKYKVTSESGDTATAGTDFTAAPTATAATLAANATSATITVTVADDGLDESDETFTVTLSDASSNATLTDAVATGTITDDDSSPVLAALTAQTVKVGETVSVTASATDADTGDTVSYAWTRKEGETTPALPPGTSVTDAELTFVPPAAGTYTMTVTASDAAGNSDSGEVVITVNPAANLVSVPSKLTVSEAVGAAAVRITTEAAFGKQLTFAVSYGDGTATGAANPADGDYDNDAATLVTFGASDTTKDISIPITADGVDESDETFTATIALAASNTLPDGFALANATTTVTIEDDDETEVTVTPTSLTVAEGSSAGYTVKLDAQPSGNVTVTVAVAGESGDVTANPKSLTFTSVNYGAAQTVTVSASDDSDRLTDAAVTLTHSASGGGYGGVSIDSVTVSVTEDDAPAKPTGLTAAPGNRAASLSWDDPEDASITGYQVSRRNAGAARWGGWASIDGSRASTVSHTATKLRNGTGYEFRIRARNGAGWGPVSDAASVTPATLPAPTVTAESGDGQVVLRWSQLPDAGIREWEWSYRGGSQKTWGPTELRLSRLGNNINHRTVSSHTVTGLANGTEYAFRLRAYNGRWSGWSAIVKATPGKATVSVPKTLRVAEGSGSATVRVTASSALGASVTFAVSYGGTATGASDPSDGDYDNDAATTVTFGAMDTAKDISIPITDDGLDEPDETIAVTIAVAATVGNALPDGAALGNATTTVTIADDDSSPMLAAIEDVSLSAGGTVDITASATDADGDTISYAWTRKAGETTPALPQDTAVNQAQLTFTTAAAGTYTMTVTASDGAGNTDTKDVTITVTAAKPAQPSNLLATAGDGEVKLSWDDPGDASITSWEYRRKEGSKRWGGWTTIPSADLDGSVSGKLSYAVESLKNGSAYSFRLRARNAAGAGTYVQTAQATPVKAAFVGTVTVTPTSLTIAEGSSGSYTVVLDKQPPGDVTISIAYTASWLTSDKTSLTFTRANWDAAQTVTVSAPEDANAEDEADTTFLHTVTEGDYQAVIDSVTVSVTDTTPVLQLSTDPSAVTEGSAISLTVTSDKALTGTLQVSLTLSDRETSGFDADDIPGALTQTFEATFGESASRTATISIPTSTDSDVEGAETYRITLNDAAGYELGADKTAEGTLNDGTVSKPGRPTGLTATAGDKRVVLTWDDPDDDDITGYKLRYAKTADRGSATFSAISGSDGDTTTYTVTGLENGAEYSFRILATSAGGDGLASKWVKATPRAAAESVSLSIADASASEGTGTLSFTVTASSAPSSEVTFKYTVTSESGDTATAGTDFTAVTSSAKGSGSISANAQTTTIAVTLIDDDFVDGADETFTVTLSEASGATISDGAARGTIEDDEEAGVTISGSSLTVAEGGSATYTVKLTAKPSGDVTVTVAGASGDVTVTGSPLTFTDQNYGTAQTVTVNAASDDDATADAAVTLTHSAAGGGYNGVTIDSVTVTVTETTPLLQLLMNPSAVTEGTAISLEVTSDKDLTGALSVSLTLADRGSSGFDADDIPGALTQTLTADFGQTASRTATISIPTSADSVVEGAETYTITLNDAAAYELGADKTAEGTLNDGTVSKPGRPTGLTATAGDKRVVLTWTDPDDDNITGYKAALREDGGPWQCDVLRDFRFGRRHDDVHGDGS